MLKVILLYFILLNLSSSTQP